MTFAWRTYLHNTFHIFFRIVFMCLWECKVDMERIQKQYEKCYVICYLYCCVIIGICVPCSLHRMIFLVFCRFFICKTAYDFM